MATRVEQETPATSSTPDAPAVPPAPTPEARRTVWRRRLRGAAPTLAIVLVPFAARASFVDHYKVPTGSMRPTVEVGDRVFVNKAAYGFRLPLASSYLLETSHPDRGDVVVLRSPEDADVVLLKRVVAIPGDLVEIRHGRIYLDGEAAPVSSEGDVLLESLGAAKHALRLGMGGGPDFGPTTLPPRKYLVVGDNRGDSRDGRVFGLVDRDGFLGHAKSVVLRQGRLTWHPL